ncbi:hypothetical protein [Micromonospora sp. NPDC048830]|uniref:hypothetical protein n=1 Tax=Micromonospora sp. NPDC048830 TaxID=3364257 RepID=UPI0037144794
MLWPWRRRSQRTAQRSTADAPAPAATAPPDAGPKEGRPDEPKEIRRGEPKEIRRGEPPAWQQLPPIQRVTPDEPRLNLPEAFTGSLAAWRDPSYLAPLGHLVGDAEPAGVLHGAAVPVDGPAAPEPAARPPADDPAPLPLAVPESGARRAAPTVQRQVAQAYGHRPVPNPPAVPPGGEPMPVSRSVAADAAQVSRPVAADVAQAGRPVPLEPVSVSRLLAAPPPAVELHLPAVDPPPGAGGRPGDASASEPTRTVQRAGDAGLSGPTDRPTDTPAVDADPPEPVDPPEAPTLGRDAPVTVEAAGALPEPSPPSEAAGPPASGAGRSAPDLPVQRVPADGPRPPRRLGLGEPIVSPLLPPREAPAPTPRDITGPPVQRVSPGDDAPVQRVPTGDAAPALVHRPPAEADEATPVPVGDTGQSDDGGNPGRQDDQDAGLAEDAMPATVDQAGLLGEVAVSRLAADGPITPVDPARHHGDAEAAGGPPPAVGDLPLTGPTPQRDTALPGTAATPAVLGTGGTPPGQPQPVQTFVPPDGGASTEARVAPLLAPPPGPTQSGADGEPTALPGRDGPAASPGTGDVDLPVVSRVETPTAAHQTPVGSAAELTRGGQPDGAPDPPPLVVARLVGDRPLRLLTGDAPAAPAPAGPSVQRITWQRDGAPVPAAVPEPQRPQPGPLAVVPDLPGVPATVRAAPAGDAGPAPVQRWVGALPGSPPDRPNPVGDGLLWAYPGGGPEPAAAGPGRDPPGPVVQRAEPADPPPPADAAGPPASAAPPPGAEPAAAGRPAAPGAPPGGGTEPEELLKKLYDPLLRRLKTELRLDRERHGVLGGPG